MTYQESNDTQTPGKIAPLGYIRDTQARDSVLAYFAGVGKQEEVGREGEGPRAPSDAEGNAATDMLQVLRGTGAFANQEEKPPENISSMSLALYIASGEGKVGYGVVEWMKKVRGDEEGHEERHVWTNPYGDPSPRSNIPQGIDAGSSRAYISPTPFTVTVEGWPPGDLPMHDDKEDPHSSQGPGSSVAGFDGSEDPGDDPNNGDLPGGSAMSLHDQRALDPMDIDTHPTDPGPAGTSWPANQPIATPSSRDEGLSNPRGRRLPPVGRRGRNLRPGDSTTPFSSLGPPSSRQETAVPPPGGTSFVTDKDILQRATKYWNSGGSTSRSGGQ